MEFQDEGFEYVIDAVEVGIYLSTAMWRMEYVSSVAVKVLF